MFFLPRNAFRKHYVMFSGEQSVLCSGKYFLQALQYEVVLESTLCKLCSTKYYWELLPASFVVRSSTGCPLAPSRVQAL